MSSFEQWYEEYERDGGELMLYNTIDLEAAFNAGMLRAAEISEGMEGSWADFEHNQVCQDIAAAIRKEAGDENTNS